VDSIEREYVAKVINFFWGQGTTTTQQVISDAAIIVLRLSAKQEFVQA
jgi:hypothetical protein